MLTAHFKGEVKKRRTKVYIRKLAKEKCSNMFMNHSWWFCARLKFPCKLPSLLHLTDYFFYVSGAIAMTVTRFGVLPQKRTKAKRQVTGHCNHTSLNKSLCSRGNDHPMHDYVFRWAKLAEKEKKEGEIEKVQSLSLSECVWVNSWASLDNVAWSKIALCHMGRVSDPYIVWWLS